MSEAAADLKIVKAAHYASAAEAGDLVFFSGQLALDENGAIVGDDIRAQTCKSLDNLARLLAERRLSPADVVKVTVWIRKARDFNGFNEAYADFFGAHRPTRSTVVSELVLPNALVELEAVARRAGR